jgi:hypothetical protein
MNEKKKIAVVIPVYKMQLSAYESISLNRCKEILSGYPIIMVKPASLDATPLTAGTSISTLSFDDHYFESVHGYNNLLMAEGFYNSFAEYEYILICQLDTFIFSDKLSYWCGQGYDYIGAPWLSLNPHKDIFNKAINRIKNYLYVRYNVKYKDGMPKLGKQLENRVGNGGLSLRRVSLFAQYCVKYKATIEHYIALRHPWFNEDIFWSIELNRKTKQLKIPGLKEALQFAFETNPARALKINNGQLPFGCHGWDKNIEFWKPVFEGFGVEI